MGVTSVPGTVTPDGDGVLLEYTRLLHHRVDAAWRALTEPDELRRWFGERTGDPADGAVLVRMLEAPDDAYPDTVRIVDCTPPHRLVVDLPGADGGAWRLHVDLLRDGADTVLVLAQRLADRESARSIGPGWQYYLDRYEDVLAGRPVTDVWEDYHPALADAYAPSGTGPAGDVAR